MLPSELLTILRCPDDRSALAPASEAIVTRVNTAIREGRLVNRAGRPVERTIEGGLVRANGDFLYPIVDQIPVLLRDDAIALDQIAD